MTWCLENRLALQQVVSLHMRWNKSCETGPGPGSQLLIVKTSFVDGQAAVLLHLDNNSFEFGQMHEPLCCQKRHH